MAQTVLQILVLVVTRNYVVYLSVQIVCAIIQMSLQNIYITRKYSEVDFSSKDRLPREKTAEIKRNVSGLIIAKIGDYLVNSTDNLIITKLVSLAATGIYSNYLLIRNMINGFIATLFNGITASMGNVVAVENNEKKLEIFDAVFFCAFLIYSIEATCFMSLYNLFIVDIWIGCCWKISGGHVDSVRIRYSKFSRVYFAGETIWSSGCISWNYYWKSVYCGLVQTICNLSNGIPCSCEKVF